MVFVIDWNFSITILQKNEDSENRCEHEQKRIQNLQEKSAWSQLTSMWIFLGIVNLIYCTSIKTHSRLFKSQFYSPWKKIKHKIILHSVDCILHEEKQKIKVNLDNKGSVGGKGPGQAELFMINISI